MRQIWVVSDDKTVAEQLTAALASDVYGVRYLVSQTDAISKVPQRDLEDPGVVFLVDAFHSSTQGFNGARELRRLKFPGHIFLCGEPAPEEAVAPFTHGEISAFLPPVHRLDFAFTAGLIHLSLHYSQELRPALFLGKGGRASSEMIHSIHDFNQLTLKLINFVSRFGVDVQKVKKVLVSVAYSHVQSTPTGVVIPKPFKLSFGLDPKKIIISTELELDPAKEASTREDFCTALNEHRLTTPGGKAARPDFKNTAKLSENFSIIWGDAQDPEALTRSHSAQVVVAIPFNFQTAKGERPYFFSYIRVKETAEKTESLPEAIELESALEGQVSLEPVEATAEVAAEATESPVEETPPVEASAPTEPAITGDTPRALDTPNPEGDLREAVDTSSDAGGALDLPPEGSMPEPETTSDPTPSPEIPLGAESGVPAASSEEYQALLHKFDALQKEFQDQKILSKSLAEDVKRLMKERRQPISQGELKEMNEELNGKVERLQAQNKMLNDEVGAKDTRMKEMEEQVKRLKTAA